MFCNQCGESIAAGAKFCGSCGTPASVISAPASPAGVPATPPQVAASSSEVQQVRPWVRYWARVFDIALFSLPAGFLVGLFMPSLLMQPGSDHLLGLFLLLAWAFIESVLLVAFGTTPGKWLFRIKFVRTSGTAFTFGEAISRSFKVLWRGLGMGLPLVFLITAGVAYGKLKKNGQTSWDKDAAIIIKHERIGVLRVIAAVVFFTAIFGVIIVGSSVNV